MRLFGGMLLLVLGCDRSGLNLAPVEGLVTVDGTPVADAGVLFAPTNPLQGPPASGTTDSEGKFSLITANRPGAAVGDHQVAIAKTQATPIPQRRGFPLYKIEHAVPPQFGDIATSGLTANVKEGEDNYFKFELSGAGSQSSFEGRGSTAE
jgi:hypothetical protein